MRVTFVTVVVVAIFSFGCSKKTVTPTTAVASETLAKTSTDASKDNPMITEGLEELNRKVQQQQYDAAVGSLVSLSQMPKSDKQQAQFMARLRETETALLQKAQQGDVAAQQS